MKPEPNLLLTSCLLVRSGLPAGMRLRRPHLARAPFAKAPFLSAQRIDKASRANLLAKFKAFRVRNKLQKSGWLKQLPRENLQKRDSRVLKIFHLPYVEISFKRLETI
jgi:hypothetical protein